MECVVLSRAVMEDHLLIVSFQYLLESILRLFCQARQMILWLLGRNNNLFPVQKVSDEKVSHLGINRRGTTGSMESAMNYEKKIKQQNCFLFCFLTSPTC